MNNNIFEFPVVDNHIHINLENGFGIEPIKIFQKYGGTHICLVSLPSWCYGINISKSKDYTLIFEKTLKTANKITKETNIKVFPILGIHPVELINLKSKYELNKKIEIIEGGIKIAAKYITEKKAIALKSGRPHFDVEQNIYDASNKILKMSLEISKDLNCPIQLHDKDMSQKNIIELGKIIKETKMRTNKVINHHAMPYILECKNYNIYPSITAKLKLMEEAIKKGSRYLFETDYMDDKLRPGAVIGTRTIPKNINRLLQKYEPEIFWKINKENFEEVYDIEI